MQLYLLKFEILTVKPPPPAMFLTHYYYPLVFGIVTKGLGWPGYLPPDVGSGQRPEL